MHPDFSFASYSRQAIFFLEGINVLSRRRTQGVCLVPRHAYGCHEKLAVVWLMRLVQQPHFFLVHLPARLRQCGGSSHTFFLLVCLLICATVWWPFSLPVCHDSSAAPQPGWLASAMNQTASRFRSSLQNAMFRVPRLLGSNVVNHDSIFL